MLGQTLQGEPQGNFVVELKRLLATRSSANSSSRPLFNDPPPVVEVKRESPVANICVPELPKPGGGRGSIPTHDFLSFINNKMYMTYCILHCQCLGLKGVLIF